VQLEDTVWLRKARTARDIDVALSGIVMT